MWCVYLFKNEAFSEMTLTLLGTENVVKRAEAQLRKTNTKHIEDNKTSNKIIDTLMENIEQKRDELEKKTDRIVELQQKVDDLQTEV